MVVRWMVLCAVVGCARSEEISVEIVPAAGLTTVRADVESGDFVYDGRNWSEFAVNVTSWGRAWAQERASEKRAANSWTIEPVDDVLTITADSDPGAGVDFDVVGPAEVDLEIDVQRSGRVILDDVWGSTVITAPSITGRRLQGNLDALAIDGSITVDIQPDDNGVIRIETLDGAVDVGLPFGLDYDLQIWGDPAFSLIITDLGFDDQTVGEGYFAGSRGTGAIQVNLYVSGGAATLRSIP